MAKIAVAIIGVGMMGGSLGLALRKRPSPYKVIGIGRNSARLARAKKIGACDAVTTVLKKGVEQADIVVICTPVNEIVPFFRKAKPFLKSEALVTDIGSVKSPILAEISSAQFVGSHPMAGSEKTGVENSQKDLYKGATVVLCPGAGKLPPASLEKMWRFAGARTIVMAPEIHDILVAQTSHLPHVIASSLVQLLAGLARRDPDSKKLLAGSFRGLTRIVDSDPKQWAEICAANRKFIAGALKSYRDILQNLVQKMERSANPLSDWEEFFSTAKENRTKLLS